MATKVELFDYAKSIGCFISFNGSFSPDNTFANANMMMPSYGTANIGGWGVFGRCEKGNVEKALADLAKKLSGETIHFDQIGSNYTKRIVPQLKHTKEYRG